MNVLNPVVARLHRDLEAHECVEINGGKVT
jgi:hypothetical protein